MDRLDTLEAFVVSVDRGSLSGAARALGRSPASVTRAVAGLEARLGVELLRRTTRSHKLTEAGERYLLVARRVLADLAEADRGARTATETPTGLVTITAPVRFGSLHVRPVVDVYLARYPDVRVDLRLLDRVVSVVDEGIDAAVRIGHLADSALVAVLVGAVRRVVCASPAYLARHGRPKTPEDLTKHRCISLTTLQPTTLWSFGAGPDGGRAKQVRINPCLSVNTAEATVGAAVAGVGLTAALSYQTAEAVRTGALELVLVDYEPPARPVHLVCPAGSTRTAKVRAFVELATSRLRAELEGHAKGARSLRRTKGAEDV